MYLASTLCSAIQGLKKMRAACKLGAEVREFAGTLVKVSMLLVVFAHHSTSTMQPSHFAAHVLQPENMFHLCDLHAAWSHNRRD